MRVLPARETVRETGREITAKNVQRSVEIAAAAFREKALLEFEIVVTVFYENAKYLQEISRMFGDIPLILQQGEHKIPMVPGGVANASAYLAEKQAGLGEYTPLTLEELKTIGRRAQTRCPDPDP